MNLKLLFMLLAITSSRVQGEEAEKEAAKLPNLTTENQDAYVYDKDPVLTKFILADFLKSCRKPDDALNSENIMLNPICYKKPFKGSYDFEKDEKHIELYSVLEANRYEDVQYLEKSLFGEPLWYGMRKIGTIRDKYSQCTFMAHHNLTTGQNKITVSCETNLRFHAKKLIEEVAQEIAAAKQQAKEKQNQSAKDQTAK